MVDYLADKRARPEASSEGEAKDDSEAKLANFKSALDFMIAEQGEAVPSYLLDRWQVPLREDEEIS